MKEVSESTICVVDHGIFLPLALKLGESFKRVLYHTPWEQGFPTVNQCVIGDGFERIERCDDIWSVKNDVDAFVFPDILHSGLQLELARQGFPVWGSRKAERIEMNRELFHRLLGKSGMEVPKFEVVVGTTALANHLNDAEDKVIKISKYRGSIETCKWRNWKLDEGMVDAWSVQFGAVKELVRFLVFDTIETDIELGCDTFNIRGQWPASMMQGYEAKDEGFISVVLPTKEMPEQVIEVLDAFGPILKEYDYANSFSMELRVKDDKNFFIDPCCRFPMPPTGSKTMLWKNLAEVIFAGAHGELVEPESAAKFSVECAVKLCGEKREWRKTEVPETLKPWLKFSNCCQVEDCIAFPPLEFSEENVGWLVATADTLDDLISTLLGRVKELPPGLTANTQSIVELLQEVHIAEKEGIAFADEVPNPASVIES